MDELPALVLAGMAGAGLGAIFFGGLWWTVRRSLASPRPAVWLIGSLALRMSVALVGIYLVGHGHWERLVACLAGFIMARLLLASLTCPPVRTPAAREAGNAS
jgi:F1F0 ATPase subunit 2